MGVFWVLYFCFINVLFCVYVSFFFAPNQQQLQEILIMILMVKEKERKEEFEFGTHKKKKEKWDLIMIC